jgi:putative methionine-R-sulfoxide reductase with GAF domain
MLSNIIKLGVNKNHPDYLNQKIVITNFVSLLLGVLSIPFCLFTYIFFYELIFFPVGFFLSCAFGLLLNYLGLHYLSRFLIVSSLITYFAIYQSYLTPDNEPLKAHMMTLQLIFWMLPWLVYYYKEQFYLISSVIFTVVLTLVMPFMNNLFTLEASVEVVEGILFVYLCYISTAIAISGSLYFLIYLNYSSEKENKILIDASNHQNQELLEKEKELNRFIVEIQQKNKEDKQRQWSSEGQASFAKLLRSEFTSQEAKFSHIISHIAKYVEIAQASIYTIKETNPQEIILKLEGLYGADIAQIQQEKIKAAEGLLEQVCKSKNYLLLEKIPKNYLKISLGFGKGYVKNLLIVPLIFNEEIFGVIELASFHAFEEHHIDFLQKIGESIAANILSQLRAMY